MRVVFFGTSDFAAKILAHLLGLQDIEVVAVVTKPDKPKGRSLLLSPPPVKSYLSSSVCIPLYQPIKASTDAFVEEISAYKPDLFIVVAYGEIIKQNLLDVPLKGCVNIHASLLPKYRGAAPIQRAMMAGEKETGITIIEMTAGMDSGDILSLHKINIEDCRDFSEVEGCLNLLACTAISETIKAFLTGDVKKTPQDHSLATFAPKISDQDRKINWALGVEQILNQIRALSPYPGVFMQVAVGSVVKNIKIRRAVAFDKTKSNPAEWRLVDKKMIVGTGEGHLEILELQLEGKKSCSPKDFLNGLRDSFSIIAN
ncbi:MAG: methionyl-tRNA formyltransferase [Rhabdochlamydiaceae bacterium]